MVKKSRSDCRGERSCSKVRSQRASCSFVVLGAFAAGAEGCYSLIGITWTFLQPKELPVLRPVTLGSALIENSPATKWQRWKKMMARVISTNFWDKNVPIVFVEL